MAQDRPKPFDVLQEAATRARTIDELVSALSTYGIFEQKDPVHREKAHWSMKTRMPDVAYRYIEIGYEEDSDGDVQALIELTLRWPASLTQLTDHARLWKASPPLPDTGRVSLGYDYFASTADRSNLLCSTNPASESQRSGETIESITCFWTPQSLK